MLVNASDNSVISYFANQLDLVYSRDQMWDTSSLSWKSAPITHPDPTAAYHISDNQGDGYMGFVDAEGNWYILNTNNNQYRYANSVDNPGGYEVNFAARAGLSYDYFYNLTW